MNRVLLLQCCTAFCTLVCTFSSINQLIGITYHRMTTVLILPDGKNTVMAQAVTHSLAPIAPPQVVCLINMLLGDDRFDDGVSASKLEKLPMLKPSSLDREYLEGILDLAQLVIDNDSTMYGGYKFAAKIADYVFNCYTRFLDYRNETVRMKGKLIIPSWHREVFEVFVVALSDREHFNRLGVTSMELTMLWKKCSGLRKLINKQSGGCETRVRFVLDAVIQTQVGRHWVYGPDDTPASSCHFPVFDYKEYMRALMQAVEDAGVEPGTKTKARDGLQAVRTSVERVLALYHTAEQEQKKTYLC